MSLGTQQLSKYVRDSLFDVEILADIDGIKIHVRIGNHHLMLPVTIEKDIPQDKLVQMIYEEVMKEITVGK